METVLLQLFNLTGEVMPTAWSRSHSEPFKAGDTQQPGNYRGITLVRSAARCSRTSCGSAWKRRWPCTKRRPRSDRSSCADQQFVLARIGQEAGKAGKTLYTFFDPRKAYDTVWRDGLFYKLLKKGRRQAGMSPAGYVRKDEFTSASERSAVGCLPLAKELDKGTPSTLLFDIYIDDPLSARMRH
jgi:hypothetical protein